MVFQLENQGYDSPDHLYLMFVDATVFCGVANWYPDDQPGDENLSNFGPNYARVDAGCWTGDVAAHELMHNLGGVQDSAPNTSFRSNLAFSGAHCTDEWDVMCYSDHDPDNNLPPMTFVCLNEPLDFTRFDCGDDDYFHTNPPIGNYLYDFWNPANNRFLIGADDITTPPPVPDETDIPGIEWVTPIDNGQPHEVSAGSIALQATADDGDGSGVEEVEFWRYDNLDEEWVLIGIDKSLPYESSVNAGALSMGINTLSADAHDVAGNWTYALIDVNRVGGPVVSEPPPDLSPVKDKKKDKKDKKKKNKKKGKNKKKKKR